MLKYKRLHSSWRGFVGREHPTFEIKKIYKMDPEAASNDYSPDILELGSVGDEALVLDLGDHTL